MNFDNLKQFSEEYHNIPEAEMESFVGRANLPILPEDLSNLCAGDAELERLFKEMAQKCFEYAADVIKLRQISEKPVDGRDEDWRADLKKADQDRHNLHEATMDSINILSRNLKERGRSNEWMRSVVVSGRSSYTRFAIAFAFSYYLSLRGKEK